jgi:propionyl-CoA carboxylase alpha chain
MQELSKGGKAIYGFNRGVGQNKDVTIDEDFMETQNRMMLRSHSLGLPPFNTDEEVRAMMVIRLNKEGNEHHPVAARRIAGGYHIEYKGEHYEILSNWKLGETLFNGTCNGEPFTLQVERHKTKYSLFHWGTRADFMVMSARAAELLALMPEKLPPDLSKYLLSPMPGLLREVSVQVGQEVKAGEKLAVIEAMKMENILKADQDCKVKKIAAAVGESLSVDQVIIEFE